MGEIIIKVPGDVKEVFSTIDEALVKLQEFKDIENHDLILTTYPLIVRDKAIFDEYDFCYIVLDEAQKIKNPKTKISKYLGNFKTKNRLCLFPTNIRDF